MAGTTKYGIELAIDRIKEMRPEYGGNPYAHDLEAELKHDGAYKMWAEILEMVRDLKDD